MHSKNNVIITPVKNNISLYKITNKNGVEAHLTNYGATLLSLYIPTKNGKIDVVLGFHSSMKKMHKTMQIIASSNNLHGFMHFFH
jgi:aldose 1-epimerase